MPIEGFPDASRHRCCLRCRKWHEPEEGVMVESGMAGPLSILHRIASAVSGLEPRLSFICHGCLQARSRIRIRIYGVLALLLALALVLKLLRLI